MKLQTSTRSIGGAVVAVTCEVIRLEGGRAGLYGRGVGSPEGVTMKNWTKACLIPAIVLVACDDPVAADVHEQNQEIVENLRIAGYPAGEIEVGVDGVIVGGDALVTLEASREM